MCAAKVLRIKGASGMKKAALIDLVRRYIVAKRIQKAWRNYVYEHNNIICPFTLERPSFPYFHKNGRYYSLGMLVKHLKSTNNWNCPVTRTPFTSEDITRINRQSKEYGYSKSVRKPVCDRDERIYMLRNTLDTMMGDIYALVDEEEISVEQMVNYCREICISVGMPTYCALRLTDYDEALRFTQHSIQILFGNCVISNYDTLSKIDYAIKLVKSFEDWSGVFNANIVT